MANRVLMGKNTNTNHGHSGGSPGYGCYISRKAASGDDINVLTCTSDELIFNTDKGTGTRVDKGIFQMVPTSTGAARAVITVAPGNSGSISLTEMGDNHIPLFPTSKTDDGVGNYAVGDTSVSITNPSTYIWSGTTYSSGNQTYSVSTVKGLSTDALW
jgi:hypothetical protein